MKRIQVKSAVILVRKMMLVLMDIIFLSLSFIAVTVIDSLYSGTAYNYDFIYISLIFSAVYLLLIILFRVSRYVWIYARPRDYLFLIILLAVDTTLVYFFSRMIVSHAMIELMTTFSLIFFVSVFVVLLPRFVLAILYEMNKRETNMKNANFPIKRTMIIGGGWTGNAIIKELQNGLSHYDPICILDDDINKKGMSIRNIPIVGTTYQVEKKVKQLAVEAIIFAIPSCSETERMRILEQCVKTKKEVQVLPYTHEIKREANIISQTQEIDIEDLLGRKQQVFDDQDVKGYVKGKICLISGGGGSIGSEICRQIAKYEPKLIIILDIYENTAYEIEQELKEEYGKNLAIRVEICSVTDYEKCKIIFDTYRPQIIFHAAAHKHVPLMETVPEQAVKNNVGGTLNFVKLASFYQAEKFVLISTDKAVNPTNVMGATKRCCEMIVRCYAQHKGVETKFCAVRFGNVLGSNGSVIPLFKKQIAHGGPVRVTNAEVTRFFMTIPEAVSLVLKTGTMGEDGEIFILDMGRPVKIVDLAENLIRLSGFEPYKDIEIEFVGLRPGEKLYEELLLSEEDSKTKQDKIFITQQPLMDECVVMQNIHDLLLAARANDVNLVLRQLKEIVPTFMHNQNGKSGN